MNTTLDELMRLREAQEAGTNAEWHSSDFKSEWGEANAAYIAAACNAIPRLVEVIRMAEKGLCKADLHLHGFTEIDNALAAIRALDEKDGAL